MVVALHLGVVLAWCVVGLGVQWVWLGVGHSGEVLVVCRSGVLVCDLGLCIEFSDCLYFVIVVQHWLHVCH